jgi:hypothetical protein
MKPGDYPLQSNSSRAAARKLIEQRQVGKVFRTLIVDLSEPIDKPHFTPWAEGENGAMGRVASIPEGMTVAEAEKMFVAAGGRLYSSHSGKL